MKKRAASAGVQLFSFLDAMICTMGALLVLLHAFARHGQIEADHKAEARAESREDPQAERETLEWRTAQLKESRAKTEAQLADERLRLSHVEDHERRLRDKFQQLKIAAAELERLKAATAEQSQQDRAELAAAKARLIDARLAVENTRRRGQEQASYSVVPYEGPNSTRRRPIYIECRANSIILQPEGIELAPEDFAGFLGPGNPLASALRGTREYYARQARGSKDAGEPYPLMLVRPEGIEAYYAARAALDSWGSEFGYELVGADWQLTFPEPDPQLAELTRQAVADARMRMRELAMTSPQLTRNRPRTTLHASQHGGFVADRASGGGSGRGSGGSGGSARGGWDAMGSNWARRGSGSGSGNDRDGGNGTAGNSTESGDSAAAGGYASGYGGAPTASGYGNGAGQTPQGGRYASSSAAGGASRYGQPGNGGVGPSGEADGSAGGEQQAPAGDGKNDAQGGSKTRQPDGLAGEPGGGQYTQTGSQGAGKSAGPGGSANGKSGGQPGGQPGGSQVGNSSTASSGGTSGSSGGNSSQGAASGMPSPTFQSQAQKTDSLAKTRGRDWGLPDGGSGVAPATRPILVECHNDRLVIVPEDRNHDPKVVRMGTQAQETIDEFVSDVWQHMKGWGIAGKGLYWRPTLVMDVKPGAADRYAEVKALLSDSGLDVHERQPRAATQTPPRKPTRK